MKIKTLVSSGVASALAMLFAVNAQADVMTATFQGTVSSGYDQIGMFGAAGANLAGDTFTSVYTVNITPSTVIQYWDPYYSGLGGGSIVGTPSPVSALLTINGVTVPISGDYDGALQQDTLAAPPLPAFSITH